MGPIIRLATPGDAEPIRDIYAPFCEATPISFETQPPSVDEMRRRIAKTLESLPWLVRQQHGKIVGYAYASPHRERAAYRWSVDVSAYVRDGHRRTGVGRALYTKLFEVLRLQGFHNALAGITLPNPGSVGLHESLGFQSVGIYRRIGFKCGEWHDVVWYQLSLREQSGNPQDPLEFDIVRETLDWTLALGLDRHPMQTPLGSPPCPPGNPAVLGRPPHHHHRGFCG
jgi:L-amino acid N-acyltransferase YncA